MRGLFCGLAVFAIGCVSPAPRPVSGPSPEEVAARTAREAFDDEMARWANQPEHRAKIISSRLCLALALDEVRARRDRGETDGLTTEPVYKSDTSEVRGRVDHLLKLNGTPEMVPCTDAVVAEVALCAVARARLLVPRADLVETCSAPRARARADQLQLGLDQLLQREKRDHDAAFNPTDLLKASP
jgi:hypothetical protein